MTRWTALWSFRTAPLNKHTVSCPVGALLRSIPILTVRFLQVWHMMRENAFHSPRIQRPYLMPCNIFAKAAVKHGTWVHFDISPARMRRVIKYVPFEVWSYVIPQNFSAAVPRFPSTCQTLRYSIGEFFCKHPTFLVWVNRIHSIHPFPKNEALKTSSKKFKIEPLDL